MYDRVREGPADEAQPRHPPAARAAARRCPGRDGASARDSLLAAGRAGPLLRRRDRHGRQRLSRRPRRSPHPDAVDRRPERRLLPRRLRPALPPAADGSGLRLPGGQRRGPAADVDVAPALAAAVHRAAQAAPGLRARHVRAAPAGQPEDLRPRPPSTRTTPCCACTTWPVRRRPCSSTWAASRVGPGRDVRSDARFRASGAPVPADVRARGGSSGSSYRKNRDRGPRSRATSSSSTRRRSSSSRPSAGSGRRRSEVAHATAVDRATLRTTSPLLVAACSRSASSRARTSLYQLLLGFRPSRRLGRDVIDGWTAGRSTTPSPTRP